MWDQRSSGEAHGEETAEQVTHQGAHCLLQARTAVLNGDLQTTFERWYPGASIGARDKVQPPVELKRAA